MAKTEKNIDGLERGLKILEGQLDLLVTENTKKAYLDIIDAAENQIEIMEQLIVDIKNIRKGCTKK
jgi:putative ubiquitin-RnfH superfamily antitoxin RatB of RatAB toxin-antitoxin module